MLLLIFNIFSVGVLAVFAGDPAPAQPGVPLLPPPTGSNTAGCPDGTTNCGNYTLNDMLSVVLKISEFILGLVGSLALLALVVGGLMWILSAGNAEIVTRGKQTIIGAVVGLAIVFTSYMIIQLVFTALNIPKTDKGEWAISNWTSPWSK